MSDNIAAMNKLLATVGGDVEKLEGDALSEYMFNVSEVYWQEFSKTVANALRAVPEAQRQDFLYQLQDKSSVFGSNYREYLTLKVKEQKLDESLVLTDSDHQMIEASFLNLDAGYLSFADFCFELRSSDIEVLNYDGHYRQLTLFKITESDEIMTRGRTEEYKIKS